MKSSTVWANSLSISGAEAAGDILNRIKVYMTVGNDAVLGKPEVNVNITADAYMDLVLAWVEAVSAATEPGTDPITSQIVITGLKAAGADIQYLKPQRINAVGGEIISKDASLK